MQKFSVISNQHTWGIQVWKILYLTGRIDFFFLFSGFQTEVSLKQTSRAKIPTAETDNISVIYDHLSSQRMNVGDEQSPQDASFPQSKALEH